MENTNSGLLNQSEASRDHPNRRAHPRFTFRIDVTLERRSTFYGGFSENISLGGLFVATYDLMGIGDQLKLEFTIPFTDTPLLVDGDVRWLRKRNATLPDLVPGMGLQFVDLSPEASIALERFIKVKAPALELD